MKYSTNKIDEVSFINIVNDSGLKVILCSLGASFRDVKVVDKNNNLESVILFPNDLNDFYTNTDYHGKTVGRYSGRIDNAKCMINGKEYFLDRNWNGINSLHGGAKGISYENFDYEIIELNDRLEVVFIYTEKENQLPGDVSYIITYQIYNEKNEINLKFEATTTKDTLVNLTNHVYFNLSGELKRTILPQKLQLLCDKYTKLNNDLVTINIEDVNEVMDFRKPHKIGDFIYDDSLQNHTAKGYDHCWLKTDKNEPKVAVLVDEESGRRLTVSTSYPAIVCYAGCYPTTELCNDRKIPIKQYHSICLECQYVPNGINMDDVDKAILKKDEKYQHYINYKFDILD